MPPSPRIAAGELRWQIQILQPDLTQDASGGVDPGATTVLATTWAKVESLTGRELYAAQQRVEEVTHKVTIRYIPGLGAGLTVAFTDPGTGYVRLFQVEDVITPLEIPNIGQYLLCRERDSGVRGEASGSGGGPLANPVVFVADGSTNIFNLPTVPLRGIMVFWNGMFSTTPDDYSLVGAQITTARTPAPGDKIVVFYL